MVRLRIALGVASSLVAVAALTIVFAGMERLKESAANVVGREHAIAGDRECHGDVVGKRERHDHQPVEHPGTVRDVDAKELWQENRSVFINPSFPDASIDFAPVPAGKALVIEHISIAVFDSDSDAPELNRLTLSNTQPFGASPIADVRYLVSQAQGSTSIVDLVTKFYVAPGDTPRVFVHRSDQSVQASATALLTGYLVNYP